MELKTGMKLGNKELAEWFEVKYDSMKAGSFKKKKLEELKEYCDFTIENNKVIVNEVYEKVYDKNRSKVYKIILKDLPNQIKNGKPWTCAQMGNYYYCKYNEVLGKKETTYEDNTRKVRNNIWGKPKKCYEGGNIIYVYCKMYRGIELKDNRYEIFTDEERKIFGEVYDKYFRNLTIEENSFIMSMQADGKNLEEIMDYYNEKTGYKQDRWVEFIRELSRVLNCDWIVRATVVEDTTLRVSKKVLENCKMLP